MKLTEHILHIRKNYPKLGSTPDPLDPSNNSSALTNNIRALNDLLPDGTAAVNIYKDAMIDLGNDTTYAAMGLAKTIGAIESANTQIESAIKNFTFLEQRNSQLNKGFSISSDKAEELANTLRDLGNDIRYGEDAMFTSATALKKLTGNMLTSTKVNESYKKSLLKTQTILREQVGITDENIIAFEQYANQIGTTTSLLMNAYGYGKDAQAGGGFLNDLVTATGLKQSQLLNTIFEGIAKTSSDVRYTTSKLPGNLELAVLKANALGISIDQLSKTGEGFLNIEQSVADELEYQQLTGQRLLDQDSNSISNQYRLAEAEGNRSKQLDLLVQAIESQKDQLSKPLNLKAFSKMFNITGKEVTDMIGQINAAKQLGLDAILTMTDPTKITAEVDKAKDAFINAGKGTAAEFDKLAGDFLNNKDKIDNRTTVEQASEKHLASISADIRAIAAKQGINVAKVRTQAETLTAPTSALVKQKQLYAEMGKSDDANAKKAFLQMGQVQTRKEISGLSTKIPSEQLKMTLQTADIESKQTKINTVTTNFIQKAKLPNSYSPSGTMVGIGSGTGEIQDGKDVLIMPSRGPIIRPAKNDVIAAFRPNDVIANTLNQTSMPTTTTTPAIDINALATAIATAVSKIKVEATIKQDTFLGTTNMNNPRLFT